MTKSWKAFLASNPLLRQAAFPCSGMTFLIPFELDGDPVRELGGERPAVFFTSR